jgi:hypothetical protein
MTAMDDLAVREQVEEAQRWLTLRNEAQVKREQATPQQCIEIAQVHATLALAIATTWSQNVGR